nr:competence type IV pilus ATPase ComGA [Secundilactobacillus folii]
MLLQAAIETGSSDLHIQPDGDHYQVSQHRAIGLVAVQQLSFEEGQQLIAHFKYRANMAITETRRPQLGAMTLSVDGQIVHLRLSSVGNFLNQESLVMRLLLPLDVQQPKFLVPAQFQQLRQWSGLRGLILFAGPTGSGKTTTIYQLARELSASQSVLSIEDPVEIIAPDFLQLQVNPAAEMSYQALIKVALRHRPEVLIVGEIRDHETAKAAVDAALSGHLVLSSVHAQTARGTVNRLSQLAIDQIAIEQAVIGVAYQRLLPTQTGDLAAYFDLVEGPVTADWYQQTNMTQQWKETLADAKQRSQISSATYHRFENG